MTANPTHKQNMGWENEILVKGKAPKRQDKLASRKPCPHKIEKNKEMGEPKQDSGFHWQQRDKCSISTKDILRQEPPRTQG